MSLEHPAIERLSAYLEEDLPAEERALVAAHLQGCLACQRELASLEGMLGDFRALPILEPPPGFTSRVMAQVAQEQRGSLWSRLMRWKLLPVLVPVAVASLVLVTVRRPETADMSMPAIDQLEGMAKRADAPPAAPVVLEEVTGGQAPGPMADATRPQAPPAAVAVGSSVAGEAGLGGTGDSMAPASNSAPPLDIPAQPVLAGADTGALERSKRPMPEGKREQASAAGLLGTLSGGGADKGLEGAGFAPSPGGSSLKGSGYAGGGGGGSYAVGGLGQGGGGSVGYGSASGRGLANKTSVARSEASPPAALEGPRGAVISTLDATAELKKDKQERAADEKSRSREAPAASQAPPLEAEEADDEVAYAPEPAKEARPAPEAVTIATGEVVTTRRGVAAKAAPSDRRLERLKVEAPDAVLAVADGPEVLQSIRLAVAEVGGVALPLEQLPDGRQRLRVMLPGGAYKRLLEKLKPGSGVAGTPGPAPGKAVEKVWIEINPS